MLLSNLLKLCLVLLLLLTIVFTRKKLFQIIDRNNTMIFKYNYSSLIYKFYFILLLIIYIYRRMSFEFRIEHFIVYGVLMLLLFTTYISYRFYRIIIDNNEYISQTSLFSKKRIKINSIKIIKWKQKEEQSGDSTGIFNYIYLENGTGAFLDIEFVYHLKDLLKEITSINKFIHFENKERILQIANRREKFKKYKWIFDVVFLVIAVLIIFIK